jgi:VIT1/CCC1 family predicted Fe2+/Mn2+ transporter
MIMCNLKEHLKNEHRQSPFSEYLKEIVYGGVDGIVTTFAVVAGFSGASLATNSTLQLSFLTVLLFGLANLFADSLSMGLGSFLSLRAERDVYKSIKNREAKEIKENTEFEREETIEILNKEGFSKEDARKMTGLMEKNPKYWTSWMMNYELELPNPENTNPFLTGLSTTISFIVFGFIPLIPFLFTYANSKETFTYSIVFTFLALFLLGVLKWRVVKVDFWRSVGEIILIGAVAASVAYFVGTLF